MIVKQLTDDGHLEDRAWNKRHAIHPTAFNDKNSTYYKEYFDKPYRVTQEVGMAPKRPVDPFVLNDIKGTRMPDCSKVFK